LCHQCYSSKNEFQRASLVANQLFILGDKILKDAYIDKKIQPKEEQVERLENNRRKIEAEFARLQEELK
jgi:cob(I)alamin adenosyltransferase